MMKNREARLVPRFIQIRVEENRMSVQYKVEDSALGIHLDDTYINFSPSESLLNAFEREIETAIKNHKK
jgi:hypothetical protein